jgi:DNA helicase-2/ATP-dependent DNA helicase PcrA
VIEDLVKDLNDSQKDAVLYVDGPSLVIAGAGSGKTRVLTHKIAHLIGKGILPNRIMALTFTNKASDEMKERIDTLLGNNVSHYLWMGTFHSLFSRILRREAEILGFTKNFTIYDSADSLNLVKSLIKELNLNEEYYKPKTVYSRISACKNNLITAESYAQNNDILIEDENENRKDFHVIYLKYCQRCKLSNVMDFDDLLLYTNILFKKYSDVLEKYKSMFDYILVDEYQDTNFAQYLIIRRLTETHRNLFVVGDDAQSIYSFRGARIQNILNFKNDYPDYKLFKLEQNYRSTQNIVNAANTLIKKNTNQIQKVLFSENEVGAKIVIVQSATDSLEGVNVARIINDMSIQDHFNYSDFAILYRTNSQSRIIEEALRKYNIPYKIYGGLSFYSRKEVKDVLAYLRLAVNNYDIEAFRRIVNYPSRKIGNTTIDKILNFSTNTGVRVWDIVSSPFDYNIDINAGAKTKISDFAKLIKYFTDKINEQNAYEFTVELVNKTGTNAELFADKTPEGVSRYENIQELLNGVKNFCETQQKENNYSHVSIVDYLENVSILTDLNNDDDELYEKVSLMTIHSAKGLEFPNVFIVGVEDKLFPSALSIMSSSELEEERRLLYVAITRAKKNLTICYASTRYRFGNIEPMKPSRFLYDISPEYLDWNVNSDKKSSDFNEELSQYSLFGEKIFKTKEFYKKTKTENVAPIKPKRKLVSVSELGETENKTANASLNNINVGSKVWHHSFGIGEVVEIQGSADKAKAIINFEKEGTKTILLKFAKLEVLDN